MKQKTAAMEGILESILLVHFCRKSPLDRNIQKVVGSSPDEVDFFNLPNSSSHIMALGSTQPLTEIEIFKNMFIKLCLNHL
jgi:hypothetical protein